MEKTVLKQIYSKIYNEEFNPSDFSKRMEMQKAIYLMQELGIDVGVYDVMWYKHGPYSQSLQNQILRISHVADESIKFTSEALKVMQDLSEVLNDYEEYKRSAWAECLGSLYYLKKNIAAFNASDEVIIEDLEKKKKHLNKRSENRRALEKLEYLFQ